MACDNGRYIQHPASTSPPVQRVFSHQFPHAFVWVLSKYEWSQVNTEYSIYWSGSSVFKGWWAHGVYRKPATLILFHTFSMTANTCQAYVLAWLPGMVSWHIQVERCHDNEVHRWPTSWIFNNILPEVYFPMRSNWSSSSVGRLQIACMKTLCSD